MIQGVLSNARDSFFSIEVQHVVKTSRNKVPTCAAFNAMLYCGYIKQTDCSCRRITRQLFKMKTFLISFAALLLLSSTMAEECPGGRKREEQYCGGSNSGKCTYTTWKRYIPSNDSYIGKMMKDYITYTSSLLFWIIQNTSVHVVNLQETPVTLSICTPVIIHPNVCYGVLITRQEVRHGGTRKSLQTAYYDCPTANPDFGCRNFECSIAWDEKTCNTLKNECFFDKREGGNVHVSATLSHSFLYIYTDLAPLSLHIVCKDKRTLWEILTGKKRRH